MGKFTDIILGRNILDSYEPSTQQQPHTKNPDSIASVHFDMLKNGDTQVNVFWGHLLGSEDAENFGLLLHNISTGVCNELIRELILQHVSENPTEKDFAEIALEMWKISAQNLGTQPIIRPHQTLAHHIKKGSPLGHQTNILPPEDGDDEDILGDSGPDY